METFAGERIEEPCGIADQQPPGPGAPGHAVAERPGPSDAVGRYAETPSCRVGVDRRDGGDDRIGDGPGAEPTELRPPRSPQHDPDVDPPAGDGCDAHVTVVQHAHPC